MPSNSNKIQAAALKYSPEKQGAPKLVAKGESEIAERIIALAKENNIPLKQDSDLVNILQAVELDEEIPLEVYSIVAEIFAFLYNVNQKS